MHWTITQNIYIEKEINCVKMRLKLTLNALKDVSQEHFHKQYFTDMHGLLAPVVGKEGDYGKFCFGNLFPITEQKIIEGKDYSVIISSPEPKIIEKLFFSFEIDKLINIGELQFKVAEIGLEPRKLRNNSIIESISPVNLTVHEKDKIRFLKYDNNGSKDYLGKNLLGKYTFFSGKEFKGNLFENVDISEHEKHPFASFQINFFNKGKNKNFKVCGSKLVFKFKGISDEQLEVFQTVFDAGFGERTTFGAGFMVVRR